MYSKWVNDLHNQPFIEMILIPSGHFTMGSNSSSYLPEKPEKEVFLHDYFISKYPITNQQFHHFIQETDYSNSDHNFLDHWITNPDGSKSPPQTLLNHPVLYVNWIDCYVFCKTYGLTLPSEAQWEKAARGSDKRLYPWGNNEPNPAKPQCNFRNIFNGTTPVGTFDGSRNSFNGIPIQKGTSPYGIEDMAGNVWEWCLDEWDSNWLTKMGENPIEPCNYQKNKKQGLSLDQIKSLTIQYQEVKKHLPFQNSESNGADRGITNITPFSTPPIVAVMTSHTKTTASASVVPSEQQEELDKQPPFQKIEDCAEVHKITSLPLTSVTSIASTLTHSIASSIAGSDAPPKQEVKHSIPFPMKDPCEVAHGSSTMIPLTSLLPSVTSSDHLLASDTLASDVAPPNYLISDPNPIPQSDDPYIPYKLLHGGTYDLAPLSFLLISFRHADTYIKNFPLYGFRCSS